MDEPKFDLGEVLRFGWNSMLSNFWYFFLILILAAVVEAVPSGLQSLGYSRPWLAAVLGVIFLFFAIVLSMGFIRVTLRICDGDKPSVGDLFVDWEKLFNYLVASILYALLVIAGLILLILPGIYWGIKYMFYGYLIVDEGLGAHRGDQEERQADEGRLVDAAAASDTLLLHHGHRRAGLSRRAVLRHPHHPHGDRVHLPQPAALHRVRFDDAAGPGCRGNQPAARVIRRSEECA